MQEFDWKVEGEPVASVGKLPLVGVFEAALILDVTKNRITQLRARGVMPTPVVELAGGSIWKREDVEAIREHVDSTRRGRRGEDAAA